MKTDEFNRNIQTLHAESNYKWLQQILQKVHGVMPPRPQKDDMNDDALMGEL
jgi:hypothetical protein